MSTNQTLFERLMAVNPADADLSPLPSFDEATETKIGEIGELERRLLVVRDGIGATEETARIMCEEAVAKHNRFHDENPGTPHGGELCKAAHESVHAALAIQAEGRIIMDILKKVIEIDYPNQGRALGLRNDGSIVAMKDDYFILTLAHAFRKEMAEDGIDVKVISL